jgi:hypothetical protein
MPSWVIKRETDNIKRALDVVEHERNRASKAWIEDENDVAADEEPVIRSLYETAIGLAVWFTCAAIVVGGLYALSFLTGDQI